jgi:putative tryptophan/tyrosine transport system substrate-binding protein
MIKVLDKPNLDLTTPIGRGFIAFLSALEAFATLVRERGDALLIGGDMFFASQWILFVVLTACRAIPTIYPWRSHVESGGLMSYGANLLDAYRQTGVYAGRILKGEKPADLPVLQSTKFELIINSQ